MYLLSFATTVLTNKPSSKLRRLGNRFSQVGRYRCTLMPCWLDRLGFSLLVLSPCVAAGTQAEEAAATQEKRKRASTLALFEPKHGASSSLSTEPAPSPKPGMGKYTVATRRHSRSGVAGRAHNSLSQNVTESWVRGYDTVALLF